MKHILIIDDDLHIGNFLQETLMREGYQVSRAYSGTEALLLLAQIKPALILLDLMLPGLSGEELLPQLKEIPVIVLSAKIDLDNKVSLLLEGAVDYVTKPFATQELLARIAIQFRQPVQTQSQLTFGEILLNSINHVATLAETPLQLTRTEFAILKMLLQNPTQVLTKAILLDGISRDTPDCTESSLKMHVSNLRKKMRAVTGKEYIEAVWGIGFKLAVD